MNRPMLAVLVATAVTLPAYAALKQGHAAPTSRLKHHSLERPFPSHLPMPGAADRSSCIFIQRRSPRAATSRPMSLP